MTPKAQVQEEAARWFAAQRRGVMPVEERLAFDAWRADPIHQAALNQMHEVWGELSHVGEVLKTSQPRSRHGRRNAVAAVLVMGLAVTIGSGAYVRYRLPLAQTGVGEQRSQELADGSILALNVMTKARYRLSSDERLVHLNEGEATFVVHKDPRRPFKVRVADFEVRAIGTAFNIRHRDHDLDVAVKDGVVEVRDLSGVHDPVILRAGQRFSIADLSAPARREVRLSTVPVVAVDEWRQRVLTYEDAPVSQVVRDLNRFYERPLSVAEGLGQRRVTLRLVVDDRADTVQRLADLLGAEVQARGRADQLADLA